MLSSNSVPSRQRGRRHATTPGERVRDARLRAGLTQEELAARAKKHVNTIANLEDNTTPVRLTARGWETVSDVAKALETTPETFGYRLKRRVRAKELTADQREVIDDILALSKSDLAEVREILRRYEATKKRRR